MSHDARRAEYAVFLAALIDSKHAGRLSGELRKVHDEWKAADRPDDWLHRELLLGALLFRHGLYFEAHEYLEEAWKSAPEDWKEAVQGVIQVAAGFHKRELDGGLTPGAQYLLERGLQKVRARAGLLGELAKELEGAVDHARKA